MLHVPGRRLAPRAAWWLVATLSTLVALVSWRFLVVPAATLYPDHASPAPGSPGPHFYALLRDHYLRFAAHFVFGPIALLVGPLQFLPALRARRPRLHRALGYVYILSVLVSGSAGLVLAASSFGGLTTHVAFGLLALLWIAFTLLALRAAIRRRFDEYRRWMVRSFALCLSAVTLRLWLPPLLALGVPFEDAYQTVAWACWVPNLLLAEALLHARPARPAIGASPIPSP